MADVVYASDLDDRETKMWREDLILNNFEENDAQAILAIPICERLLRDKISWVFTKDGNYSIKTAYMVGKACIFDNFHQSWVKLWSLDVSPKIRHFCWRICTSTLPVRSLLKSRHLIEDFMYPICHTEFEQQHVLLTRCGRAMALLTWSLLLVKSPS